MNNKIIGFDLAFNEEDFVFKQVIALLTFTYKLKTFFVFVW